MHLIKIFTRLSKVLRIEMTEQEQYHSYRIGVTTIRSWTEEAVGQQLPYMLYKWKKIARIVNHAKVQVSFLSSNLPFGHRVIMKSNKISNIAPENDPSSVHSFWWWFNRKKEHEQEIFYDCRDIGDLTQSRGRAPKFNERNIIQARPWAVHYSKPFSFN